MENQLKKTIKHEEREPDFIDLEWLELIFDAKRNGLTVNEVRDFFLVNAICDNSHY